MATESTRDDAERAVVCFYGITDDAKAIRSAYHAIVAWFESLGHPADKLGVSAGPQKGPLRSFRRAHRAIDGPAADPIDSFELYSTTPGAKLAWHHCYLAAMVEAKPRGSFAYFLSRIDVQTLPQIGESQALTDMVTALNPSYGIGYTMPNRIGPGLYAFGLTQCRPGEVATGEQYEEKLKVCRWGDIGMVDEVYRNGILRDIYPLNFLNETQLKQNVSDQTLRNWITQGCSRGHLRPFVPGLECWSLEPDQIPAVREVLAKQPILFDWRRYV